MSIEADIAEAIPGVAQAKWIIGVLVALVPIGLAIALVITRHTLADRTAQRDMLAAWQSGVRQTTSTAAHVVDERGRPALLAFDQVGPQITLLGAELDDRDAKIATQNQRIADLANNGAARIAAGNAALAQVEKTSAATEATIAALRASAAANTKGDGACTPSETFLQHSGEL